MVDENDPVFRVARQHVIRATSEVEKAIADKRFSFMALEILYELRRRAAESMTQLAFVNLCDPAELPKALALQNEVKRYDEWFVAMGEIARSGKSHIQEMDEAERDEMLDVLLSSEEGRAEARALGLIDEAARE